MSNEFNGDLRAGLFKGSVKPSSRRDSNVSDTITVQKRQMEKRDKILSDYKEYHEIFRLWRFYDSLTTLFAMLGLLLAIINFELDAITQDEAMEDIVLSG